MRQASDGSAESSPPQLSKQGLQPQAVWSLYPGPSPVCHDGSGLESTCCWPFGLDHLASGSCLRQSTRAGEMSGGGGRGPEFISGLNYFCLAPSSWVRLTSRWWDQLEQNLPTA